MMNRCRTSFLFAVLLLLGVGLISPSLLHAQGDEKDREESENAPPAEDVNNGAGGFEVRGARIQARPSVDGGALSAPSVAPRARINNTAAFAPSGAQLGATVGGAQDIGYARQLIEAGRVPGFIDISPEGLYSEHDIPTPSGDCDSKLCLSLGYGFAPTVDDQSSALFVHLGMSSNIRPEEFKRPKLQLAIVIDNSGSMSGNLASVKQALKTLAGRLTADDEITLITFNSSAQLVLPITRGNEQQKILAAIDGLSTSGGTNIEAGIVMGFKGLAERPSRTGTMKRLMLFTDAMPNIGRTDSMSFRQITERHAAQDIGLTTFGVGINFGQDLVYHITQLRGGNFFFLENSEKIARVFDNEFDYLVTPLVYDLKVKIATPKGLRLKAVYGLPGFEPNGRDVELTIPTVFLSSNRGAIVLRYERDGQGPLALGNGDLLATGSLSYTDVNGKEVSQQQKLRHAGSAKLQPGTQFYTHDGMRMAVALTNIYFGLHQGCILVTAGKRTEALDLIGRATAMARLENLQLADAGLNREIALLEKLAENINAAAEKTDG